jgi:hypothetical protein
MEIDRWSCYPLLIRPRRSQATCQSYSRTRTLAVGETRARKTRAVSYRWEGGGERSEWCQHASPGWVFDLVGPLSIPGQKGRKKRCRLTGLYCGPFLTGRPFLIGPSLKRTYSIRVDQVAILAVPSQTNEALFGLKTSLIWFDQIESKSRNRH